MSNAGIQSDIVRGHIDMIILSTILNKDMYGLDIINYVKEKSNSQYKMKEATLYSCLNRLEKQSWVESYYDNSVHSGGGQRKYFKLTALGRDIYNQKENEWHYSKGLIDKIVSQRELDAISAEIVKDNNIKDVALTSSVLNVEFDKSKFKPEFLKISEPSSIEERNYKDVLDRLVSLTKINGVAVQNIKATDQTKIDLAIVEKEEEKLNTAPIEKLEKAENIEKIMVEEKTVDVKPIVEKLEIETNAFSLAPHRQSGKIDYTQLTTQIQKEGFKIRTHSTESVKHTHNFLLINKMLFHTMLVVLAFVALEVGIMWFCFNKTMQLSNITYITTLSVVAGLTAFSGLAYCIYPKRKLRDTFRLTVPLIVSIMLFVTTFIVGTSLGFITGANLKTIDAQSAYIIFPCVVALNVVIAVVFYSLFASMKRYHI